MAFVRGLLLLAVVACAIPLEVRLDSHVIKLDPSTENYDVQFSITNSHTAPVVILKWNTPLDRIHPFPSDMFYIRSVQGGKAPVYIGIAQKRYPVPSDFETIRPNETLKVSLDLLNGYWFPSLGEYEVTFSASILVHEGLVDSTDLEGFEPVALASSPISVIIANLVPMPELYTSTLPSVNNSVGSITAFTNCTTTVQDQSKTADSRALTLVNNVISYLNGKSCSSADLTRYVTWFGTCDANRFKTIGEHMNDIKTRINNGYRMYCSHSNCGSGVYAYVYPNDSTFTVYVCSGYLSAPTCAYDSKPGTIIHELSHFTAVAGTQDIAYGTTNCQNLAKSNPANAVKNADSHEYMAESGC